MKHTESRRYRKLREALLAMPHERLVDLLITRSKFSRAWWNFLAFKGGLPESGSSKGYETRDNDEQVLIVDEF